MPGIITMRLLSYCFGDPNELLEDRVLKFLNTFNANTGALDLIQSSWAGPCLPVGKRSNVPGTVLEDARSESSIRDLSAHLRIGSSPCRTICSGDGEPPTCATL